MDKVRLLLVLVTIAFAVGPLAGVVVVYRNNLRGLVVPPEIENGSFSNLVTGNAPNGSLSEVPFGQPQYVSSQADPASRSYSLTFNLTNPLNFDLTLNSMSANVEDTQDGFPLGQVSLSSPVHLAAGQTSLITVNGTWTEEAANHLAAAHPGAKTMDVDLVGLHVDMGGVNLQLNDRITVANVPIP